MRALDMTESAQRRAIAAFNRKSGSDRVRSYLRVLKAQPHAAEGVLRASWRMLAWADGQADAAERDLIDLWGKWLGWTPQQLQALAADYTPGAQAGGQPRREHQDALRCSA